MKKFFSLTPLLLIIVVVYNALAFWDKDGMSVLLYSALFFYHFPSGDTFVLFIDDLLLVMGLFILYFEILKSTHASDLVAFEHILSIFTFLLCFYEFIFIEKFGNSTFLILTLMTLFDVCAGITITISVARRDLEVRM